MTNTVGIAITTTMQDVFEVPDGVVRHITMIHIANIDGTAPVDVTAQWTDADNSDAVTRLVYLLTVQPKDARPATVGAFALMEGDKLQMNGSANGDAEATITYYDEVA
ncbi:hypothetical protein [Shinella sp.]|uniref:hypothetical protein n=1 Tax=Shinella sp. TaxID=1870904 RepID=UPI003F6E6285